MSEDQLDLWMDRLVSHVRSHAPDFTNRQLAVLLILDRVPGPHTVRGLAATLNVKKPVISRAIDTLSALGFAERKRDDDDRRNVFVNATHDGSAFLTRWAKEYVESRSG